MDVLKSLSIIAIGIACVHCQNPNPVSDQNARTLATGGNEFVVTGGGNQPSSGGSGSLLDIALASFGTSSGGPANPTPVDQNQNQPPQTPPVGSSNFVDAVNNLLSTGTSQMDPNVLTNLGLPTEQNTQNTGTQPMDPTFDPTFQSNPGPIPPNDPTVNIGGGVPLRDPNSVPLSDPNAGPVDSGPVRDPNAIGGGIVLQVDPQNGMNRGPAFGDTAAVQYSSAGRIPQNFPDPNTAGNVIDRNSPLPSGSVFDLTGQTQPGIYPTMPSGVNTGGPSGSGPLSTVGGSTGGFLDSAGRPLGSAGGILDSVGRPLGSTGGLLDSTGRPLGSASGLLDSAGRPLDSAGGPFGTADGPFGIAGGPLSSAGGPLGNAGGPLSSAGGPLGSAGRPNTVGPTDAVFGVTGTKQMNGPLPGSGVGGRSVIGAPPSGGILSSFKNNGMPGPGIASGPLAALKATSAVLNKNTPPKNNGMMDMLLITMLMGGGEMNPALMAMAMGSMGGGGGNSMMLPLILSMSGGM